MECEGRNATVDTAGQDGKVRAGTAMVSLPGKIPFGVVGQSIPPLGNGKTRAGRNGSLNGDVAVRTEANHAFPGSADSRQENGQKDSPCDDRSRSKTPHTRDPSSKKIKSPINHSVLLLRCNSPGHGFIVLSKLPPAVRPGPLAPVAVEAGQYQVDRPGEKDEGLVQVRDRDPADPHLGEQ